MGLVIQLPPPRGPLEASRDEAASNLYYTSIETEIKLHFITFYLKIFFKTITFLSPRRLLYSSMLKIKLQTCNRKTCKKIWTQSGDENVQFKLFFFHC